MKSPKLVLIVVAIILNSCASNYKTIDPNTLNYTFNDFKDGVLLEYKYELFNKRYTKKEKQNGMKIIAVKITNNSEKDIVFGDDFELKYKNGTKLDILGNKNIPPSFKQKTATYLLYLLLTPLKFTKTTAINNNVKTSTTPIGLAVGPGIALGNMLVAKSSNKKFKNDLLQFDINGATIKKGETKTGLIGVLSERFYTIKIN